MTVDGHDIVWMSENWAHNVVRFDPSSNSFVKIPSRARAAEHAGVE
jgi:streptogramin lyase